MRFGHQTTMRTVLLLCSAALCAAHLWPSRRGRGSQRPTTRTPGNEATWAPESLKIHYDKTARPSTPATTPTVRAGRRRPVLRGRPRQRHRLQEGRVGPRDAGRTTRAEGEILRNADLHAAIVGVTSELRNRRDVPRGHDGRRGHGAQGRHRALSPEGLWPRRDGGDLFRFLRKKRR